MSFCDQQAILLPAKIKNDEPFMDKLSKQHLNLENEETLAESLFCWKSNGTSWSCENMFLWQGHQGGRKDKFHRCLKYLLTVPAGWLNQCHIELKLGIREIIPFFEDLRKQRFGFQDLKYKAPLWNICPMLRQPLKSTCTRLWFLLSNIYFLL